MGAFLGLSKFFGMDLATLAKKLHYSQDNLLVLQGKEKELAQEFPEIYKNLCSCEHNRDTRSAMEYAKDLVATWLFEDYLVASFRRRKQTLQLTGNDKERKILQTTMVSSSSDCMYCFQNKQLRIEVMNDYSGFWERTHKLHLRDEKYHKLEKENAILLAVSTVSRTYFLIDFGNTIPAKFIESHKPYGYKPAYEIDLKNVMAREFLIDNIIADLQQLLS